MTPIEMTTALNAASETGFYGNYDERFQISEKEKQNDQL